MKAITGTLARASIPRLQVRSLCSDWAIGADKLYQLLNVMDSVELLRIVRFENDTKAKTAGQSRRISIEVGGSSKDRKKSDFVIRDDSNYPTSGSIPLRLLGMMY